MPDDAGGRRPKEQISNSWFMRCNNNAVNFAFTSIVNDSSSGVTGNDFSFGTTQISGEL